MDGRREGRPEEDGCHKLEDTCTPKRRLEDGREGGQGPTRTVEPWSSSSIGYWSQSRDDQLSPKQRTAKVNRKLLS